MERESGQRERGVLSPDRSRLAEARAAIGGIDDPREAWEVLASRGIVPLDWVEDPRRTFAHEAPPSDEPVVGFVNADCRAGAQVYVHADPDRPFWNGRRMRAAEPLRRDDWVVAVGRFEVRPASRPTARAWPPTIAAVLALAADVEGVTTAEALAREHFGDAGRAVCWRVLPEAALDEVRRAAEAAARGAGMPNDLRAVLALGYFVRGLARESDGAPSAAIVLVAAEPTDDEGS